MLTLLSLLSVGLETSTSESPAREILWTDTLTAIGTVGAVVLSLVLAIVGWVTASVERGKRRAEAARAAARAQAEQGHWWLRDCDEHPSPWESEWVLSRAYATLGLERCWGDVVVLENKSDAPMHEIVVNAPSFLLLGLDAFVPGSLGPRERRVFHVSGFGGSLLDPEFYASTGWLSFADADGKRWRRLWSGTLVPATTSRGEDQKVAEQRQLELYRTLRQLGEEERWVDSDGARLAEVKELLTSVGEARTPSVSRYLWQQLHSADEVAFGMLQKLPYNHWRRRVAAEWWRWRSGRA